MTLAVDLDADLDDPDDLDDLPLPDVAAEVDDADRLVEALLAGEVVVLPTDTVYGVGALPADRGAMDALFAAKGRGRDAPMAVLCAARTA